MNFAQLREPFPAKDIEWRVQRSGVKNGKGWAMVLAYVTNRAIMQRLDDVVGPENWKNEYTNAPDDGVLCGLSIRVSRQALDQDGTNALMDEWVTKYDGAENTAVEAVKGGLSGAMKRAAVQWGIGRYLYNLESNFVEVKASGDNWITVKYKDGGKDQELKGYWNAPTLPEWALPDPAPVLEAPEASSAPQKPELLDPSKMKTLRSLMGVNGHTGDKATDLCQFIINKEAPTNNAEVDQLISALEGK